MNGLNFRVWDIKQKVMTHFGLSDISVARFPQAESYHYVWKNPSVKHTRISEQGGSACNPIMRGTGLFYKNGQEIFEGDIFNTIHARWLVEFYDAAFYAKVVWTGVGNLKSVQLSGFCPENIIHLGNIYQTPEKLQII